MVLRDVKNIFKLHNYVIVHDRSCLQTMDAYLRKQLPRIFHRHLDSLQDVVDDSVIEEERQVESTEAGSDRSKHNTGHYLVVPKIIFDSETISILRLI